MAIIGKIRNRAGLIIGAIGFAMLAFIAGDLITNNKSFLFGNKNELAVIAGESVSPLEFNGKVEELTKQFRLNSGKDNPDPQQTDQIKEQSWDEIVKQIIYGNEYKSLGIVVSDEEIADMLYGKNVNPQVKQAFTDPKTGIFDPQTVINFLQNLDKQNDTIRTRWYAFEDEMKKERYETKLKDLAKFGLYSTTADSKRFFNNSNKLAKIKYVVADYRGIADSSIKISDEDYQNYYKDHQYEFKQQETTRKIEFVTYDVNPSEEDRKKVQEWADTTLAELKASTIDDTLFVNRNSDTKYDGTTAISKKGVLPPNIDTLMFKEKEGFIYGPYEENSSFKIAKLSKIYYIPDSVRARHILINVAQGQNPDSAKAIVDSLKKLIVSKKAKFEDLARKHSQDQGSAIKGGDLGWFTEGKMVKPFQDSTFYNKKGDLTIVQSQFGYHLIEILDQSKGEKRVKVVFIDRKVEPSTKTFNAVLAKANEFVSKVPTGDKFDSVAKKAGLRVTPVENLKEVDKGLPGIENGREIVSWAYRAKQNEVSAVKAVGSKYVIAHLLEIKEKGILPLELVKHKMEPNIRREKKAAMLIDKMTKAGGSSIDDIAAKLNLTVDTASKVSFASGGIPGKAFEPEVIGKLFTLKQGETSKPWKGNGGVYIINVTEYYDNEPAPANYKGIQARVMSAYQQKTESSFLEALKDLANIIDNRGKYF